MHHAITGKMAIMWGARRKHGGKKREEREGGKEAVETLQALKVCLELCMGCCYAFLTMLTRVPTVLPFSKRTTLDHAVVDVEAE